MKAFVPIHPLIAHLWTTNREQIISQSRMHCHAKQVHSVMLLNAPGRTIRLFVALPGHELWHNTPEMFQRGMSVGFHPHHCELTLLCVRGAFVNWTLERGSRFELLEFTYSSALRGGAGGFKHQGSVGFATRDTRLYVPGECVYMPASQIHTIACAPGEVAAWLVFEGREDDRYDARCYSTSNLEAAPMAELYHQATEEDVQMLLETAGLVR